MAIMDGAKELGKSVGVHDIDEFFINNAGATAYFCACADWVSLPANTTVVHQFHQAEYFYLLVEGAITFAVDGGTSGAPITVGKTARRWAPVGWSGLLPPGRYGTTVTTSAPSRFIRWPIADLWKLLYSDPRQAAVFFECLARAGLVLLEETRRGIRAFSQVRAGVANTELVPGAKESGVRADWFFHGTPEDAAAVIGVSAFFREFTDEERWVFAASARFMRVRGGVQILEQDADPDGIYLLARGRM